MERYTLKDATLEARNSYKDICVALGGSDIATLIMVGMTMENRPATVSHLEMKELNFGEDGEYSAWLVDGDTAVPEHYTLTAEFKNWLKIYDDEGYCTYFTAPFIRVYQAGQFGCLIQLCQEYSSIKQLKEMLKSDKKIIAEVMEEEVKRILNSDKTTYQIAKETGVSTAIIDNYRTGKSKVENMTMNILQKLICGKQETKVYLYSGDNREECSSFSFVKLLKESNSVMERKRQEDLSKKANLIGAIDGFFHKYDPNGYEKVYANQEDAMIDFDRYLLQQPDALKNAISKTAENVKLADEELQHIQTILTAIEEFTSKYSLKAESTLFNNLETSAEIEI